MEQQRYSARRAFKYNGTFLDRGRVMALAGCANDEKLPRLGLLTELDPDQQLFQCRLCGAEFISERQRTHHGKRAHEEDPVERAVAAMENAPVMTKNQGQAMVNRIMNDPDYEPALVPDETISAQEKENEQEAPIFFDKTEASVRSGAGVTDVTLPPIPKAIPDPDEAPKPKAVELAGRDLKKWRTKQGLSLRAASKVLGVRDNSIARAEKLGKKPLGPKLAPSLQKALGH